MCNHNMAFKNIDFQHLWPATRDEFTRLAPVTALTSESELFLKHQQSTTSRNKTNSVLYHHKTVSLCSNQSVSELSRVSVTFFVSGSSLIPSSSVWATVESDLSNSCENLHPQPIFWWSGDEEILVPRSHQDQDQCWYMFNSSLTRSCSSLWQLRSVNNSSSRH